MDAESFIATGTERDPARHCKAVLWATNIHARLTVNQATELVGVTAADIRAEGAGGHDQARHAEAARSGDQLKGLTLIGDVTAHTEGERAVFFLAPTNCTGRAQEIATGSTLSGSRTRAKMVALITGERLQPC